MKLDKSGSRIDSDGVKLFCARMAKNVADRAMQVSRSFGRLRAPTGAVVTLALVPLLQTLGGYGYVGEYEVERLWRDAKLLEIGGGTNGAHQKNMAKDLGKFETLP